MRLCKKFDALIHGFHMQVEQEGVGDQPAVVPKRKGRRSTKKVTEPDANAPLNQTAAEVRIGTTKQSAVRQVLMYASPDSYKAMLLHVSVCGGQHKSALSDTVLNTKWLWPGSTPPQSQIPNDLEELARRSSAKASNKMLPQGLMHPD